MCLNRLESQRKYTRCYIFQRLHYIDCIQFKLWPFYLRSSLVHLKNELVILLVFFCQCLSTADRNTYCMVTLLEDATVFITSIFYQYFISLLILYIQFTLRSQLVCLLITRYQRAVPYALYCVLVSVLFSVWALLFLFQCVFVHFRSRLHCGYFIATIGNCSFSFVFNVNLWHDFEIKQENFFWFCHHCMRVSIRIK